MAARNVARPVVLDSEQREQLGSFRRSRNLAHARVQLVKVILLAADGMTNIQIAKRLGTTRPTIGPRTFFTSFFQTAFPPPKLRLPAGSDQMATSK